MPNFSTIATPLNELVKKGVVYKWGKDQEKAFETLKLKLINAPLLALPNFSKTFGIECDASNVGIGVVLLQEGHPEPILVRNSRGVTLTTPPMTKSFMLL